MDNPSTEQEIKKRKQKGAEPEVLTPKKTPSWQFGLSVALVFVIIPLLIFGAFYFHIFNL